MSENTERETMNGGESGEYVVAPDSMRFREEGDTPTLEGRMMPYDEWTEVRSPIEGHFMERFSPGALQKTMVEQANRIRVMFEHGTDSVFGKQAIAAVDEMRDMPDGAYYRASLLDGVPDLLVSGLRRGLYGSSIRFQPVKWDRARTPKRSEHNPDGIPEHTIREAAMKEFSVVPFPQYAGATAMVRSTTYDIAAREMVQMTLQDPERLLEILRTHVEDEPVEPEPQHSEPDPPEEPADAGSRRTQPTRDYLSQEVEEASWRL